MPRPSLDVRLALAIYGSALRWVGHQSAAPLRAEQLQIFRDACDDVRERRGVAGVCLRTAAEIWDLIRSALRPGRRTAQVSEPAPLPPNRRRSLGLWVDVRQALRAIAARRVDAAIAVALLALGLATSGSIFAVTDALLMNAVPFPHADRIVSIWSSQGPSIFPSMPRDLASRWLDRTDLLQGGGVYKQASALVTTGGDPEVVPAAAVSPGLFETLGVRPILGRSFTGDEGSAGNDRVAIISADLWASRLGSAPDVIGRTMRINSADYTIVGVMASSFRYPTSRQRIWLPYSLRHPPPAFVNDQVTVIAGMAEGLTREQLDARVKAAGSQMAAQAIRPWRMGATTRYVDEILMDPSARRSIWILFGATVLLMLTVCANVANLGLSQAFSRLRDASIRSALGASRGRMIRAALIEQLVVGGIALAVALPLTAVALKAAAQLLPVSYTLSSLNPIDVDGRLLAMMITLAMAAPMLAGVVPALVGARANVIDILRLDTRSISGSRASRLFRRGLVVLEVACSVVLLVAASLLVRSFLRMQSVETGFDNHRIVSVNLGFPAAVFPDAGARELYANQAVAKLRSLPGVEAAALATGVPPQDGGLDIGDLSLEGDPASKGHAVLSVYEVAPDFFSTLGLPVKLGRALTADDPASNVVISESMALKYWPGTSAVGRRFRHGDDQWLTVVGVAATVREAATTRGDSRWPQMYVPLEKAKPSTAPARDAIPAWMRIAVRTAEPAAVIGAIRPALRAIDPGVLVDKVDRVDDLYAKDLDRPRFLLGLMIIFASAGLLLAAIGLYGVLSCLVAEQLREFGIRLMLGAAPPEITRAIVLGAIGTTAAGFIIGGFAAAALGRTINAVLFDVPPGDVTSYAVVAAALLLAALAAAWRPARRAARVDPALLLR